MIPLGPLAGCSLPPTKGTGALLPLQKGLQKNAKAVGSKNTSNLYKIWFIGWLTQLLKGRVFSRLGKLLLLGDMSTNTMAPMDCSGNETIWT